MPPLPGSAAASAATPTPGGPGTVSSQPAPPGVFPTLGGPDEATPGDELYGHVETPEFPTAPPAPVARLPPLQLPTAAGAPPTVFGPDLPPQFIAPTVSEPAVSSLSRGGPVRRNLAAEAYTPRGASAVVATEDYSGYYRPPGAVWPEKLNPVYPRRPLSQGPAPTPVSVFGYTAPSAPGGDGSGGGSGGSGGWGGGPAGAAEVQLTRLTGPAAAAQPAYALHPSSGSGGRNSCGSDAKLTPLTAVEASALAALLASLRGRVSAPALAAADPRLGPLIDCVSPAQYLARRAATGALPLALVRARARDQRLYGGGGGDYTDDGGYDGDDDDDDGNGGIGTAGRRAAGCRCCCRGHSGARARRGGGGGGGLADARACLTTGALLALALTVAGVAVGALRFRRFWDAPVTAAGGLFTAGYADLRPWAAVELALEAVGSVCALAAACGLLACARAPRRGLLAAAVAAVAAWGLAAGLAAPRLLLEARAPAAEGGQAEPVAAAALLLLGVVVITVAAGVAGCYARAEPRYAAVLPVTAGVGAGATWGPQKQRRGASGPVFSPEQGWDHGPPPVRRSSVLGSSALSALELTASRAPSLSRAPAASTGVTASVNGAATAGADAGADAVTATGTGGGVDELAASDPDPEAPEPSRGGPDWPAFDRWAELEIALENVTRLAVLVDALKAAEMDAAKRAGNVADPRVQSQELNEALNDVDRLLAALRSADAATLAAVEQARKVQLELGLLRSQPPARPLPLPLPLPMPLPLPPQTQAQAQAHPQGASATASHRSVSLGFAPPPSPPHGKLPDYSVEGLPAPHNGADAGAPVVTQAAAVAAAAAEAAEALRSAEARADAAEAASAAAVATAVAAVLARAAAESTALADRANRAETEAARARQAAAAADSAAAHAETRADEIAAQLAAADRAELRRRGQASARGGSAPAGAGAGAGGTGAAGADVNSCGESKWEALYHAAARERDRLAGAEKERAALAARVQTLEWERDAARRRGDVREADMTAQVAEAMRGLAVRRPPGA